MRPNGSSNEFTLDHPAILAACPLGEWHELGLMMICLFLARRGYTAG